MDPKKKKSPVKLRLEDYDILKTLGAGILQNSK